MMAPSIPTQTAIPGPEIDTRTGVLLEAPLLRTIVRLTDMHEAASGLSAILDVEMNLHVKLCAGWGLSPRDLEQAPPASEMLAYTRYVLDAGSC